jgi:hypothetical protein
MALAVNCWLLAADACVCFQVCRRGIFFVKTVPPGQAFIRALLFSLSLLFPQLSLLVFRASNTDDA